MTAEQIGEAGWIERAIGVEATQRPPHDLGARVVEDLANDIPLVDGLVGEPAVKDESDLVPVSAESVKDVFQHAQATYVDELDVKLLAQFATYGRLGRLTEVDAPTQGPVEGLVLRGVVILEDEQVLTATWHGQGNRAD